MIESAELELVKKAQNGDSVSMEALIFKYMWLARSKARKYFLVSGGYDDLLQEGLMGIFKAIRDFNPSKNESLTAFISMCIGSQIKDAIRSSSREKHRYLNDAVSLSSLDENVPPEYIFDPIHSFIDKEGVESFYKKLNTLFAPSQMEVLKYYLEGYTYSEIADMVKMSSKKVDNTLHAIKTKIKKNKELFL